MEVMLIRKMLADWNLTYRLCEETLFTVLVGLFEGRRWITSEVQGAYAKNGDGEKELVFRTRNSVYHCPIDRHSDGFFDFAGAYNPIPVPVGALKAEVTPYGVMAAPGVRVCVDPEGVMETNAELIHNRTDEGITVRDGAGYTYRIPPYGAVIVTEDRHRIREEEDEFGFDDMEDLMEDDNDPDDHPDDLLEGDDLPFS